MTDFDALIERLQGFNPPDRTIASQRDYSQAIHDAAAALVQLREERDALAKDAGRYRWLREQQGIRNAILKSVLAWTERNTRRRHWRCKGEAPPRHTAGT